MIKMIKDSTLITDKLIGNCEDLIIKDFNGANYFIPKSQGRKAEKGYSLTALSLNDVLDRVSYKTFKISEFLITPGEKKFLEIYSLRVNTDINYSMIYDLIMDTPQSNKYQWVIAALEYATAQAHDFRDTNFSNDYLSFPHEALLDGPVPVIKSDDHFTTFVLKYSIDKLLIKMSNLMKYCINKHGGSDGLGYYVGSYIALGIILSDYKSELKPAFMEEMDKIYTGDYDWNGDISINLQDAAKESGISPKDFDSAIVYIRSTKEAIFDHPFLLDKKNAGIHLAFSMATVKKDIQYRLDNRTTHDINGVTNFTRHLLETKQTDTLNLDGIIVYKDTLLCWYEYFMLFNRLCDSKEVSQETEKIVLTNFHENYSTLYLEKENEDNIRKVKSELTIQGFYSTISNLSATSRFFEQHLKLMIEHIYQVPERFLDGLYHFVLREYITPNELSVNIIRILLEGR